MDPREEHYGHDARDYKGLRPKDLDDALISDVRRIANGFDGLSAGVEGIKKRNWPTILMAFSVLGFAFSFGIWVTNYNRNAQEGSPALVKLDQKLTKQISDGLGEIKNDIITIKVKDDSRYDKLNEILVRTSTILEQSVKRLDRLEDRK